MPELRECNQILSEIKKDIYRIDEDNLYNYTKFAVLNLHQSLAKQKDINIKCSKELIDKLKNNSQKYRITKDIDEISIQYIRLFDYINDEKGKFIKLYVSLYFYDNTKNNEIPETNSHYYEDIWIVTYKCDNNILKKDINRCNNCGAVMNYNNITKIYKCEYCENTIKYDSAEECLEMTDIEIFE